MARWEFLPITHCRPTFARMVAGTFPTTCGFREGARRVSQNLKRIQAIGALYYPSRCGVSLSKLRLVAATLSSLIARDEHLGNDMLVGQTANVPHPQNRLQTSQAVVIPARIAYRVSSAVLAQSSLRIRRER